MTLELRNEDYMIKCSVNGCVVCVCAANEAGMRHLCLLQRASRAVITAVWLRCVPLLGLPTAARPPFTSPKPKPHNRYELVKRTGAHFNQAMGEPQPTLISPNRRSTPQPTFCPGLANH